MMVNCSTSGNVYHHPNMSCSQLDTYLSCFKSGYTKLINVTALTTVTVLLLPLHIFIFYLGLQKWQRQRSLNNTDFFTINFAITKLTVLLGHITFYCGIYFDRVIMAGVGYSIWSISWHAENLFHFLTCTDRYLAVVYPILYVNLKSQRWNRIRNIFIGCVWLMSFGLTSLILIKEVSHVFELLFLALNLILVIFFNISMLFILIHPGSMKQCGKKDKLNQSKKKALYTITAILGVLTLRFGWNFVWMVYETVTQGDKCMFFIYGAWLDFPSNLLLPFLFLHKTDTAEMCLCCKKKNPAN